MNGSPVRVHVGWSCTDANAHIGSPTYLELANDRRMRLRCTVRHYTEGTLAAVVSGTGGWLDLERRRLVTPPRPLRELLESLPVAEDFAMLPAR